jgi:hypothetical protein
LEDTVQAVVRDWPEVQRLQAAQEAWLSAVV